MGKRAERRIIFVIVEGPSDETALAAGLQAVFSSARVMVEVVHGDVTTETGVDDSTILGRVGKIVQGYAVRRHFLKRDFLRVIHVLDTDGAFVRDDCVKEDPSIGGTLYSENGIRTAKRENILKRNRQKRTCLQRLARTDTRSGAPYPIAQSSCQPIWNMSFSTF